MSMSGGQEPGAGQKPVDVAAEADIAITRKGAAASIVLKRMRAHNALTLAMREEIARAIPVLARDFDLYAVILRSESAKAFSAGGDVRELFDIYDADPAKAIATIADEYALNWTLDCFSKPTVSLIDGVVMGSGVGITIYNTHRVAGAGYKFAMPETAIGLFPDVGVAHVLARLPGEMGTYLGLTGRTIGRADAYHLGLATHCVEAVHFDEIQAALADAQTVDPLLDGLHKDPGVGPLAEHAGLIAECFSAPTVESIVERLGRISGAGQGFAQGVMADLAKRSPTSLKITLAHLRRAAGLGLRDVLVNDQRLACRCLTGHDFREGVRAALVDKDNLPVWRPATLREVSDAAVEAYFAPLPEGEELVLKTREQMQTTRERKTASN